MLMGNADFRNVHLEQVDLSIYILAVFNLLFLHTERKICACMFVCLTVCVRVCVFV